MKYYQISLDIEVTGVNDGLYQIDIDKSSMLKNDEFKDFLDFFRYANSDFWKRQDEIEDFKIPTIKAKLLKKAKVTDIMGYTPNITFLNEIYSQKFINIIKSFNIRNYKTFEVDIENVKEKYYLLFIKTILSREIDYTKSIIYTGHKLRKNIEYFNFNNYEEYWEFLQTSPLAKFEIISLPKKYFGRDIIEIQASSLPFYSEKLIDFLLDCGITGLRVSYKNSIQLEFV